MNKSKMSIVVIFSTIITVTAMINPEIFTMESVNNTKVSLLNNIKKINFFSRDDGQIANQKVKYNDVVQSSEVKVKEINTGKVDLSVKNSNNKTIPNKNSKTYSKSGIILTEEVKKYKLNSLHESQLEDIKNYYDEKYAKKENSKKEISKETSTENETNNQNVNGISNKNETPVFKVSKEEIKENLTLSDKQKILSVAMKLSPADYEKINQYLNNDSNEQGVIDAIKLLRDRLSDKDYDKIKEVAGKFLNLDVVEKK